MPIIITHERPLSCVTLGLEIILFCGKVAQFVLIFGLAQVPLYLIYGLANSWLLVVIVFAVHGAIYALIQPAVDAHVAASATSTMRAGVQGLYSTFGLFGAFVGNSGFGPLYQMNFHLPLLVIGVIYGICVLSGGLMIRTFEKRKSNVVL